LTGLILKIMLKIHSRLNPNRMNSDQPNLIAEPNQEYRFRRLVFWILVAIVSMLASSIVGIGIYAISGSMLSTFYISFP
jgi:hypothetical protein